MLQVRRYSCAIGRTPFRHSRLWRLAASAAIAGQVLIAAPVFAQDAAHATVNAAARVTAIAQRKAAKASVHVNRTAPKVTAPAHEIAFGVNVSTEMIRATRLFEEPLIPTAEPSADENRALGQLLQSIAALTRDQQAARVDGYVLDHADSPWKASLLANAASWYAKEGYLSRAASNWQQAFELTKDSTEPGPRAIADYAVGQALSQMATFGQLERMGTLLTEIEGRNVRGTAAAKVSFAREALTFLSTHHEMATFSGPAAVKAYLAATPTSAPEHSLRTLAAYHAPASGTSLSDLQALASDAGAPLQMVHFAAIGEIPVPSIVHLRSQHYSAIVGRQGDRYIVRDSALGGEALLTAAAIRDESSGYFLISAQLNATLGGRVVPSSEAATVVGHCIPGGPASNDPACAFGGCVEQCGGTDGPGGGEDPGGGCLGMPGYSFHPQKVSLLINDTLSDSPKCWPLFKMK